MKKIFVTFAALGLMLAGCTNNVTDGYDVNDPNVVGFAASTTRASIYTLQTLQDDGAGFKVFGTTANVDNAWYTNVNGTNNYAYASGAWGWAGTDAVWPTTDGSYPMYFYAMYPVVNLDSETVANLSDNIEIAAAAANQVDMLSAKASTPGKPASGQISLAFQHILSKINFGVIAGHEMTAEVRSLAIRNVHKKSTYNYLSQAWSGTTTDATGYDYYVVAAEAVPFFTTGGSDEETPAPIYTGSDHSSHLMLMPQSSATGAPAAWDKTAAGLANGAYIEVMYNIADGASGADENYVGYTKGTDYLTDYPAFAANNTGWGATYTGGLGTGAAQYDGFLYVRVGFPVTLNWEAGKGYTYNICLGTANSSNGYYIDEYYYDDEGVKTNIPIVGPDGEIVDQGDPVTDGIINFLLSVTPWGEDTTTAVQ